MARQIEEDMDTLRFSHPMNITNFLNPEDELQVVEDLNDDTILEHFIDDQVSEEEKEDDTVAVKKVTSTEATTGLNTMEQFLMQRGGFHKFTATFDALKTRSASSEIKI